MALSQQAKIREETPRSVSRRAGGILPTPHLAEQACGRDYDPYSERGHARTQQNFIEKSADYSPCSPLRRECRTYPCRSNIAHRDRTAWLRWSDSNSDMSSQMIPLKDRADCGNPAEFWPQRLFAFELRRWADAARV